jgi:hypothetical protein
MSDRVCVQRAAAFAIVVPHDDSARIEEARIFIAHIGCGQIERSLGLVA